MSGNAQGWAWEHGPATKWGRTRLGLKQPDRCAQAVLVAIGDDGNHRGEHAHPGLASLIDGTGYSRRSVLCAIERLIGWGYLTVQEKGGGRGHATVYNLPGVADPSWVPETVQVLHCEADLNGADGDEKRCSPEQETVQSSESAPSIATNTNQVLTSNPSSNADAARLCGLLADEIHRHRDGQGRPAVTERWLRDMRLLLERGALNSEPEVFGADRVERCIRAVFGDLAQPSRGGFCWADQIRSPGALREHWWQIRDAAKAKSAAKTHGSSRPVDRQESAVKRQIQLIKGAM